MVAAATASRRNCTTDGRRGRRMADDTVLQAKQRRRQIGRSLNRALEEPNTKKRRGAHYYAATREPADRRVALRGSKADVQIRDSGAEIGLRLGGPLPERMLHMAHALFGPFEHRPPGHGFWQCPEQAFVEKIIHAMSLTTKG